MAKNRPSRLRPLTFWFMPITRSQSQQSTCKDLERDGQARAITPEATYTPIAKRSCSRSTKKPLPPRNG
ncbi:Malolactic regulator [Lacticaseibacillus rhamnosus]|nr:Malolactic regulator [Lacticaseibacillus rhamnosus]MCT3177841.1 Malolactic regulator [Lacticaseibacillus rhamnosus]MCT3185346.1 Malolactic regulator [Lacticaseibacillus rhamnosus]MCT4450083.1 Malolactic regulator [Lacticaseibacillus rhamnosus]